MDQDATWYGDSPRPRPHCARWGPSFPSPKKGAQPPIFGPCLLWPNGWMDQDATWYNCRPGPGQHCVRCGPSSTPRDTAPTSPPQNWPLSGYIKMALGTKTTLCDMGTQLPLHKTGTQPPIFGPRILWPNGRPSQLMLSTYCRAHGRESIYFTTGRSLSP